MSNSVPEIPNKMYFTIGEVSKVIGIPTHSIRYWEKEDAKFKTNVIKTKRSKDNARRVYAREVVMTLLQLKTLIADNDHTVPGALKILSSSSKPKLDATGSRYAALLKMLHRKLANLGEALA